jgi:raffinose/stachyose/melibiose transport system permease protein
VRLSSVSRQVLLCVVTVAALAPLTFMLVTSLKSPQEYADHPLALPTSPTLSNYATALTDVPTVHWAINSLLVTVGAVLVSSTVAALAAYAVAFGSFRGRQIVLSSAIGFIMVPPVVLLLPMFVVMVNLHLVNRLWSVMIFYSCLLVPFAMFFLVNFFQTVPRELIEASVMDGAGPLRTLRSVVLPLSRPALVTIAVVNAVWAWNELLVALVFLQDESRRTLMAGLTLLQGRYVSNQPLVLAVAVLSIVPVALFYLFTQRSFVRGLTAGMGK